MANKNNTDFNKLHENVKEAARLTRDEKDVTNAKSKTKSASKAKDAVDTSGKRKRPKPN